MENVEPRIIVHVRLDGMVWIVPLAFPILDASMDPVMMLLNVTVIRDGLDHSVKEVS